MGKSYNIDNPMPPLWLKYPEMPRGSIGWRMGFGEDYLDEFYNWYISLKNDEQKKYQNIFPEPIGWLGWYDKKINDIYDEKHKLLWNKEGFGKIGYDLSFVKNTYDRGKKLKYVFFWGHQPSNNGTITKTCFSQWWKCSFEVDLDEYCCMEQYMMAEKARLFDDEEVEEKILKSRNPGEIKALGRQVRNFDEKVWLKNRYSIVLRGNYQKFIQNKELREFLLNTKKRVLVEASPVDKVWGVGLAADDENIENPFKWKGLNLLGFALMEVREEILRVCGSYND